jgi:hypothetical protein
MQLRREGGYAWTPDHPNLDARIAETFTIQWWAYFERYPTLHEVWPVVRKEDSYILRIARHQIWDGKLTPLQDGFAITVAFELTIGDGNRGGGTSARITEEDLPLGEWHHFAWVKNATASAVFVNGKGVAFSRGSSTRLLHDSDSPLSLGGSRGIPSFVVLGLPRDWRLFDGGLMDEVEVADVVRYPEFSEVHRGDTHFAPPGRLAPDEHTVALWHFNAPFRGSVPDSAAGLHPLSGVLVTTRPALISPVEKNRVPWGLLKQQ